MKNESTITVASGYGVTVKHGAIIETGDGKQFVVTHKWWRRFLHWATFGWVRLHSSTVLTVKDTSKGV